MPFERMLSSLIIIRAPLTTAYIWKLRAVDSDLMNGALLEMIFS